MCVHHFTHNFRTVFHHGHGTSVNSVLCFVKSTTCHPMDTILGHGAPDAFSANISCVYIPDHQKRICDSLVSLCCCTVSRTFRRHFTFTHDFARRTLRTRRRSSRRATTCASRARARRSQTRLCADSAQTTSPSCSSPLATRRSRRDAAGRSDVIELRRRDWILGCIALDASCATFFRANGRCLATSD